MTRLLSTHPPLACRALATNTTANTQFYDVISLFEESTPGKSSAMYVKVRVMEDCFLVLLRMHSAAMGGQYRMLDTRYFHEFGSSFMLRDRQLRNATSDELRFLSLKRRPFSGSISEGARRDERFLMDPDTFYELTSPVKRENEIVGVVIDSRS